MRGLDSVAAWPTVSASSIYADATKAVAVASYLADRAIIVVDDETAADLVLAWIGKNRLTLRAAERRCHLVAVIHAAVVAIQFLFSADTSRDVEGIEVFSGVTIALFGLILRCLLSLRSGEE
jgi:hypothetical protein